MAAKKKKPETTGSKNGPQLRVLVPSDVHEPQSAAWVLAVGRDKPGVQRCWWEARAFFKTRAECTEARDKVLVTERTRGVASILLSYVNLKLVGGKSPSAGDLLA